MLLDLGAALPSLGASRPRPECVPVRPDNQDDRQSPTTVIPEAALCAAVREPGVNDDMANVAKKRPGDIG